MPRSLEVIRDDDRAFRRLLLTAMVLGFLALLGAAWSVWSSTDRNRRYTERVEHSVDVRQKIARFQVTLEQSETARRGYLLTPRPLFLELYRSNSAALEGELAELRTLTLDNPDQTRRIERVRVLLDRAAYDRDRSVEAVRNGLTDYARDDFARGTTVIMMRAIRMRLRAMDAAEALLLTERANEQAAGVRSFLALLGGAGILLVVVAAVSFVTMRRFANDLGQSHEKLRALNETLEDQVADRTADLARANDEIQRFAYIVSHDLRSPLVNVMGFTAEMEAGTKAIAAMVDRAEAEAPGVVDEDARLAAREDLPEAIGFIRTSTAKMDRLINAILKLSREGRRTIAPEPIAMAAVIDGVRATLQHRLDEVGGTIAIDGTLPDIVSDRLAIEQVFGNVIENAVKYRAPDRPLRIAVSGRVAAGRATFAVADNGRGIAATDHARVFDLFRRSGTQDQPGEGIGLAHVRALTYRLGGTIDVTSALGEGATFGINLPLRLDASGTTQ
ncbi:sensor histidine kinase [Sphingomonas sp. RS2018]